MPKHDHKIKELNQLIKGKFTLPPHLLRNPKKWGFKTFRRGSTLSCVCVKEMLATTLKDEMRNGVQ